MSDEWSRATHAMQGADEIHELRGALSESLRLLAELYDASERGSREVEAHLRAHGWAWVSRGVGGRWCSPEGLRRLPRCQWCGDPYEPQDRGTCHAGPMRTDAVDGLPRLPEHEAALA